MKKNDSQLSYCSSTINLDSHWFVFCFPFLFFSLMSRSWFVILHSYLACYNILKSSNPYMHGFSRNISLMMSQYKVSVCPNSELLYTTAFIILWHAKRLLICQIKLVQYNVLSRFFPSPSALFFAVKP